MLITSTNYAKTCEQKLLSLFSFDEKKYINLLKVDIESAQQFNFGHSHMLKQKDDFKLVRVQIGTEQ